MAMTGLTAEDRDAIASSVASRIAEQQRQPRRSPTTAGEAVGILAGAVAGRLRLGRICLRRPLALRRMPPIAETAGVIGQLPREFLITAAWSWSLASQRFRAHCWVEYWPVEPAADARRGAGDAGCVAVWSKLQPRSAGRIRSVVRKLMEDDQWPDLRSRVGKRVRVPTWLALIPCGCGAAGPRHIGPELARTASLLGSTAPSRSHSSPNMRPC